ncbi:MAG: hypothetical protein H7145_07805 [Akkermansiaceae bacterium]|nr:hypothetical protein [Armatimonadota bacterium]
MTMRKQILLQERDIHVTENAKKSLDPARLRRRKQSGMMLATMLGLMTCLLVLLSSAALLATNMIQSTKARMDKADSVNMADAGVDLGVAWLQSLPYPPSDAQVHPLNSFWGGGKTRRAGRS